MRHELTISRESILSNTVYVEDDSKSTQWSLHESDVSGTRLIVIDYVGHYLTHVILGSLPVVETRKIQYPEVKHKHLFFGRREQVLTLTFHGEGYELDVILGESELMRRVILDAQPSRSYIKASSDESIFFMNEDAN
jgi:hypothetical protein